MTRLLAAALLCALPARAGVQVWIAGESEKVRPGAALPARAPARILLSAAGGECAAAQIVVRSDEGMRGLTASADPLRGPRGKVGVELSRVATIALTQPSGPEGSAGEWPDALVPVRDAIWNEPRRAFPVDVGSGRAQGR